jgi:uncharacterized membrane protein YdjX (TVP38/TMEM64 family)
MEQPSIVDSIVQIRSQALNDRLKTVLIIIGVMLIPVIPFLILSNFTEPWADQLQQVEDRPWLFSTVVVALLVVDIVLPLPSTTICTIAGGVLGGFVSTMVCWLGLNLSAALGYFLSYRFGRPFAVKYSNSERLEETAKLVNEMGPWALAICRALPIMAEASVFYVGLYRMDLKRFWPPILLANLFLSFAYCVLGSAAKDQEWFGMAITISIFVPFFAMLSWMWFMKRRSRKAG